MIKNNIMLEFIDKIVHTDVIKYYLRRVTNMANAKKPKATHRTKKVEKKSFVIYRDPAPFFTFMVTDQTVYWLVLLTLITALSIWVLNIQIRILDIVNEVNELVSFIQ